MGLRHRFFLLIILLSLCFPISSFAQQTASEYESYFDLGLKTGSYLPSKITGVTDLLPIWGVKMGHPVSQTLVFEYDFDFAHAKGVEYMLGYFSLRHNFTIGRALPLFFLIGADIHYYKRKDSVTNITMTVIEHDWKFASGWHIGVGGETMVYGDIFGRADIRMGFSPGRQLTATLGAGIRF